MRTLLNLIWSAQTRNFTSEYMQKDKTYESKITNIHLAANRIINRNTLNLRTDYNIFSYIEMVKLA